MSATVRLIVANMDYLTLVCTTRLSHRHVVMVVIAVIFSVCTNRLSHGHIVRVVTAVIFSICTTRLSYGHVRVGTAVIFWVCTTRLSNWHVVIKPRTCCEGGNCSYLLLPTVMTSVTLFHGIFAIIPTTDKWQEFQLILRTTLYINLPGTPFTNVV